METRDVRSELLSAATQLFAQRGYEATSLQDIAGAVSVRKQSLLYHFGSKEELRRGVLDALLARWNEVLPRLLIAATSGEDRFTRVFRETVRFFADDVDRARLLLREILDRPGAMRGELESYVKPWIPVVAEYVRKGQAHGEVLADVDPEAYVLCVINLVVSGVATAASLSEALLPPRKGPERPAERCQRELTRIAFSSLFAARPPASAELPTPVTKARRAPARRRL